MEFKNAQHKQLHELLIQLGYYRSFENTQNNIF